MHSYNITRISIEQGFKTNTKYIDLRVAYLRFHFGGSHSLVKKIVFKDFSQKYFQPLPPPPPPPPPPLSPFFLFSFIF